RSPGGTLLTFSEGDQGTGINEVEDLTADLDRKEGPILVSLISGNPFLDEKTVSFEHGEEVALDIRSTSSECWCKWELEVVVAYGVGHQETVRIRSDGTANGPPFETVAWSTQWKYTGGHYDRDEEWMMTRVS